MQNFQLSESKVNEILDYSNSIYDKARKLKVKDNILDKNRTGREINLQGMGAEVWYKEKYNLPYNLEATIDEGPRTYKKDIDCLRNDLQLEIKQTSYPTGCLFISALDHYGKTRKLLSNVYVLIIGSFPNYIKDLHVTNLSLTNKFFDKPSNILAPTMHPKIGKFGYHLEQEEMFETFEEALEADGRLNTSASTMS